MSQELSGATGEPSPLPDGLLLQTQPDDPPESVGGGPKPPTVPQDIPLDPNAEIPPAPEDVTGYAEQPPTGADDPPESVGGGPS